MILQLTVPPTLPEKIVQILNDIAGEQIKDSRIGKLRNNLKADNKFSQHLTKFYKMHNNILFIKNSNINSVWAICIPKHLEKMLIRSFHEYYGHPGPTKTAYAIKKHIHFPKLFRTVRQIVRTCDICQGSKIINYNPAGAMVSVLSQNPLDKTLVDIYGPLPTGLFRYTYIFVVVDNFSRYVKLYPLCKATAKACLNKIVKEYIPQFGLPKVIVSDHGRQFIAKTWEQSLIKLKIRPLKTSVYHPQSNPAERVMRELADYFELTVVNVTRTGHNMLNT